MNFLKNSTLGVVLCSFLVLFLELSFIRYLPTVILYLGFFSNFILLASFFGIGIGFLLAKQYSLSKYFPILILILIASCRFFATRLEVIDRQAVYFRGNFDPLYFGIPPYIFLPALFLVIAAIFACIVMPLARYFSTSTAPLKTYTLDIIGSLLGIFFFYVCSFLGFPPLIWFGIVSFVFLLTARFSKLYTIFCIVLLFIMSVITYDVTQYKTIWSPYYKINIIPEVSGKAWDVYTNEINHQYFSELSEAPLYQMVFRKVFEVATPSSALIIGAGTGQDVSSALSYGVETIDAVEIDPSILAIGKMMHPTQPYSNPGVRTIVDDGRNFLHNTDKKYDLILYSLTDSLRLASERGNVRLESYLFTKEAMEDVKSHLNKDGLFVVYNDYRYIWLVKRIQGLLMTSFHSVPTSIFTGPTARIFIVKEGTENIYTPFVLPTDDWPFVYIEKRFLPTIYVRDLTVIVLITLLVTLFIFRKLERNTINIKRCIAFFLLGAAFSLIETKSIVQLNLLFGVTWITNALSFGGVLFFALLGVLFTSRVHIKRITYIFIALVMSLTFQYFFPIHVFLSFDIALRFILSTLFFFIPIFLANILFANYFKSSKTADVDFGSNIIGLVAGGVAEYFALIGGYSSLSILALLFYVFAFLFFKLRKR